MELQLHDPIDLRKLTITQRLALRNYKNQNKDVPTKLKNEFKERQKMSALEDTQIKEEQKDAQREILDKLLKA